MVSLVRLGAAHVAGSMERTDVVADVGVKPAARRGVDVDGLWWNGPARRRPRFGMALRSAATEEVMVVEV